MAIRKHKQEITDDGARILAALVLKQAIRDWEQTIRQPVTTENIVELQRYFKGGECALHCALAGIEQDDLVKKMEQLRK